MTREQIEQWAREADKGYGSGTLGNSLCGLEAIERFAALVAAHEREQCALVCDEHQEGGLGGWKHNTPMDCAAAIRARGELSKVIPV